MMKSAATSGHVLCWRRLRVGCGPHIASMLWTSSTNLLFLLTNRHLPLLTRGKVLNIREECDAASSRDSGHDGGVMRAQ